jgi:hypothetical protein
LGTAWLLMLTSKGVKLQLTAAGAKYSGPTRKIGTVRLQKVILVIWSNGLIINLKTIIQNYYQKTYIVKHIKTFFFHIKAKHLVTEVYICLVQNQEMTSEEIHSYFEQYHKKRIFFWHTAVETGFTDGINLSNPNLKLGD